MSIDMSKYQEIAKRNIHNRPAGVGRLAGKICIVTGAAQGFGKGIAEELHKEGATIVIADMNWPPSWASGPAPLPSMWPTRNPWPIWWARPWRNTAAWT